MREIKFRCKTFRPSDEIGWKYGSYISNNYVIVDENGWRYIVDGDTVGQYTGLKDKNGVEIYEGDIVYYSLFNFDGSDIQRKGVVKWSDTNKQMTGYFIWHNDDNEYYGADGAPELGWVCAQDDEIEVIGNIYDNPELLEAEE